MNRKKKKEWKAWTGTRNYLSLFHCQWLSQSRSGSPELLSLFVVVAAARGWSHCCYHEVCCRWRWGVSVVAGGRTVGRWELGSDGWWVRSTTREREKYEKIRERTLCLVAAVSQRIGSSVKVRIHTYWYVTNAYPYRIRTRHGYFEHKHVPMLQRCYISKL